MEREPLGRRAPKRHMLVHLLMTCCLGWASLAFASSDENRGADASPTADTPVAKSTVGFPQRIDQKVINGPELVVKPIVDRKQPMIVRILETYPHGTAFRYDFEFRGLEPGTFNLADYLQRKDPDDTTPIEPIYVTIESLLGEGQVEPSEMPIKKAHFFSFYRMILIMGGILWGIGFLTILLYGRQWKRAKVIPEKRVTVAERLKPLVEAAAAGKLDARQQAELERVLQAFWRKKLHLDDLSANELRETLRRHPESAQWLEQMDAWIHSPPESPVRTAVDVQKLLEPYQGIEDDQS